MGTRGHLQGVDPCLLDGKIVAGILSQQADQREVFGLFEGELEP